MKPIVYCITATKDRHVHLERVVRFFLDQTYDGKLVHLIYNNSSSPLRLNTNLPADKFLLINNHIHLKDRKLYTNLGDIYNDVLKFLPAEAEVVTFMDDDDIYLPSHIEEGIKGWQKGGKIAYKPQKSWYKQRNMTFLTENTFEPSIFVAADHVRKYGFSSETSAQHLQWIYPLRDNDEIFVDSEGKSTYICDWSQEIKAFKASGDAGNPENFNRYSHFSKDVGDGIITPCSKSWGQHYYEYAKAG